MYKTFAKRLCFLMDEHNTTVKELSNIAGVSRSTLSNWRADSIPTDFQACLKIANHFGVSFCFLMTGQEQDTKPPKRSNKRSKSERYISLSDVDNIQGHLQLVIKL